MGQLLGAFALEKNGGEPMSRAKLALMGRLYTGNMAAAGAVIPIYSSTTQQFGLWNPLGSGRIVEVAKLGLGSYVDTTGAAGGYVVGIVKGAPANLATGAAITVYTETAAENALPGFGENPKAKFAQGATITVTAPTILRHLSLSQNAFTAAVTTGMFPPTKVGEDAFPDRDLWVPPGNAIFLCGNIATLAKFAPVIVWGEHDWAA